MTQQKVNRLYPASRLHEINLTFSCTAPYDYIDVNTTLIIFPGETSRCIAINITDDGALEGNQTFQIVISTSDSDVNLENFITDVVIDDDDSKIVATNTNCNSTNHTNVL